MRARMIIEMIVIIIIATIITMYEVAHIEIDVSEYRPEVEPIVYEVELPVITGVKPEVLEVKELVKAPDKEEVDLLARLIQAEAGADWCTDELQLAVGSVVLNRVNDDRYPDTMHEVIYQPGQYSTAKRLGTTIPTDRAVKNATALLTDGATIPEEVVFQANFPQRTTYKILQGVYFGK